MKIRYTLIIAAISAALGYGCAPAIANQAPQKSVCNSEHGCIDFDKQPELIGCGLVYEP
ncbi:hypothetical protein [Neisseria weixii]|uniref:hypothetical protein n=1 Tax=Neisseria weixii TaxID=1853276 RepID=UPI0013155C31|nr:hypothetical protein [Neisseria weixii]